jgi:phenylpropionate dioxygenase-like ring-hydroxylating dioxygenase large terminal subunit
MNSEFISRLVDDRPEEGVFRVHPDVYSSPELFDLEQTHVFERTWIFLGIESQIPRPNDYLVGWIGRLPVLITHGADGRRRAFLNVCRHKGTLLCRLESGNARYHVCPYHGWAYDAQGHIADIKDQGTGAYTEAFQRDDHDLVPLGAFASYRGLMFGAVSAQVPPLEDFLGELRFFLDLAMEQGPGGMEFVPGRIGFTYQGNWKAQLDNSSDAYHLTSTHLSFMEVQRRRADAVSGNQAARQFDWKKRFEQEGGAYTFANGHNLIWLNQPEMSKRPVYPQLEEVRTRVGELKAEWMLRLRNLTVFPSVQIADSTSLLIRTFRPVAVDQTEMRYYCLAPIGEPAEVRAWRLRQFEDFFNVSGFATPDDTTMYEDMAVGLRARQIGWVQGYARGMAASVAGPDAMAREAGVRPESSVHGMFDLQAETWGHAPYREWARLMATGEAGQAAWPDAAGTPASAAASAAGHLPDSADRDRGPDA